MGQDVPLHHPYPAVGGVFSITDGREVPVEARGFFSEGLFALPKQLQRVRLLLLGQTDTLSSPATDQSADNGDASHLEIWIQARRERRGAAKGHRAVRSGGSSAHRTHC